jgi:aldehyde dehydrogenase (NAD+)
MIDDDKVIFWWSNWWDCYIAPTLINEYDIDSLIMKDEIFGPLLPIIEYSSDADIYTVFQIWKPLSLYVFTENKIFAKKLFKTILWRRCINDTIIHFSNKRPWRCRSQWYWCLSWALSFDTFHIKVNSKKANWLDLPRYVLIKTS